MMNIKKLILNIHKMNTDIEEIDIPDKYMFKK